ncbi:MAG: cytochrome c biogenesis protein ResB [Planctomycetota bacterium]|nr:cytochrome c biogenesis protein ResB [Planctomycetota bacterium]MDG2143977.1 cytochrome c biogenesis protein ResB [Planctomycetota bacterium]
MAKKTGNPIVDILSSLQLACVMLSLLFILTLLGTLYQVEHGLYEAKEVFFSSWFIWKFGIPIFPSGLTCMTILTANMLTGGLIRLKISKRNLGVVITHIGIALMLGSGMVKVLTADEGNLALLEGERSNFFSSLYKWEVAITEVGGDGAGLVIQDKYLSDLDGDSARTVKSDVLPFDVTLSGFVKNSRIQPKGPMWEASGPVVDGFGIFEMPPMKESEQNASGMHVEIAGQQGILWGFQRAPWTVKVDGRTFLVDMRHERYEMPFSIELIKFMKEEHPGMSMAKAYRSDVYKIDESGQEKIRIQMNEPLRSENLVLFQSSFGTQASGTYSVFSVVDNVSDQWPLYSLWVVTAGMLLTFVQRLVKVIISPSRRRTSVKEMTS